MSLWNVILALVCIALVLGAINWIAGQLHADAKIIKIINVIVLVVVVLWLISLTGLFGHLNDVKVPQLR